MLDKYLQDLVLHESLQAAPELFEFLSLALAFQPTPPPSPQERRKSLSYSKAPEDMSVQELVVTHADET